MGAKLFGARVARLEDPALLTGRGRFVDDIRLPGMLHAAFVRSPHAHARIRSIDATSARALPGVRAVLSADDLPPRMARVQIPMLVPNSFDQHPADPARFGARRGLLCRPDDCGCDCRQPLPRRGCRCGGQRRVRGHAGSERLPRCGKTQRRARAQRSRQQRRGRRPHELRRRRRRICRCAARLRGGIVAASRRGDDARGPRRAGELRCRRRHVDGVVGNPDAASLPRHAGRPVRARSRIDPGDRALRRRRLRDQGAVLRRGGGDTGSSHDAGLSGNLAGGPARALPVGDAGTRPAMESGDRRRRARDNSRPARHHAARHRSFSSLGHHRSLHRGDDVSGSLRGAELPDRGQGRLHQPGANYRGARCRPPAGGFRHGATPGSRGARAVTRPRRGPPAQHDPARADAPFRRAGVPRRQAAGLCQRRFPEKPGAGARAQRLRRLSHPPARGAVARTLSRHRDRQLCRGHRPRSVRGGHGAGASQRQDRGRDRGDDAGTRHPNNPVTDRRRRPRLPHRRRRHDGRRYRGDLARDRRLREPPGYQCRFLGADRRRQRKETDHCARCPRARRSRRRHRRRGRPRHRSQREQAIAVVRRARPPGARDARLLVCARPGAGPRAHRLFHAAAGLLLQRHPRRRSRGRSPDRRRQAARLHRRARQRQHHQSADRQRPGAGRRGPRHRQCAVRMDAI